MVRIFASTVAALCAGVVVTAPAASADTTDPASPATVADPPASAVTPGGVPHLSSPENLPPGTTDVPPGPQSYPLSYLRELWHAVQSKDLSGKDAAILLLTQRPMDADTTPPPGLAADPQQPASAPDSQ